MHMIVIGVSQRLRMFASVALVFVIIWSQHSQDHPVVPFHLPICLGVVVRCIYFIYAQNRANVLEEPRAELSHPPK